ncbi:MAG: hypothetical protein ASARMPRED_006786 [Alectoria sarmentosa]|nr:MAG: hypothetical protein ASARMPRED_006786 [Alectoria sarmentosa]
MATHAPQRSFHTTDTEYNLPNDSPEHARLEEQAAGYAELMHNNIIHAPLSNPQRLLDIGCGTGAVTHHLGTTYPAANCIYGIDLSPIPNINRPGESPGNISFIQGDVRKLSQTDERLAPGTFDYIFSRLLICGMTDWAGYMRDTVAPLLKPGGWVEVQDLDYVWYKHGHVCSGEWKWLQAINEGAKRKEAGLVDVSVKRYGAPFGTWAVKQRPESERIGAAQAEGIGPLYEIIVPRLAQGLGLSESEVQGLVGESRECLRAEDGKEWVVYVTVGRRPS